jgi:hypothetical protein
MTTDASTLVQELQASTASMNVHATADLCEQFVTLIRRKGAVSVTPADAVRVLRLLRRKRMFAPLVNVAEAYFRHIGRPPALRIHYAQALLDQDMLAPGLSVLTALLAEQPDDPPLLEEARGLLGRAYKQAFVQASDAGRPTHDLPFHGEDALRLAVGAYADAYQRAVGEPTWPAINLVALLVRAGRDGVAVQGAVDPLAIARKLLSQIEDELAADAARDVELGQRPPEKPWLLATALEASLALGDDRKVVAWGKRYLACQSADAFEFGSTLRQLTEIWQQQQRGVLGAAGG